MTLKEALARVIQRQHLRREEMAAIMGQMLAGEATPAQVGALAAALRLKGETEDELLGAAEAMRAAAARLSRKAERVLDTCGTGGDGAHTFNISTAVAFVAAGAGVTVAKHGNRAVSSRCGSVDLLGPLTNPVGARYQFLGTFAAGRVEQTARVLGQLGSRREWVVHGQDRLDGMPARFAGKLRELASRALLRAPFPGPAPRDFH